MTSFSGYSFSWGEVKSLTLYLDKKPLAPASFSHSLYVKVGSSWKEICLYDRKLTKQVGLIVKFTDLSETSQEVIVTSAFGSKKVRMKMVGGILPLHEDYILTT